MPNLLNKKNTDIEIIIIDDCSEKKNTEELIVYLETICDVNQKLIINKENKGGAESRNIGAKNSIGNWIWFIDDDDNLNREDFKKIVDFIRKLDNNAFIENKNLLLMQSAYINTNNKIIKIINPETKNLKFLFSKKGHEVNTSCSIFKRKFFEELGGWDNKLVAGQDTDIFLRAAQITDAILIPNVTINILEHEGYRITTNPKKQMIGKYQFLIKNWSLLNWKRRLRYIFTFIFFIPYIKKVFTYIKKVFNMNLSQNKLE